MNQQALSSFIGAVADLLRGDYKQAEDGKVILPFTVLRRLDCPGPTPSANSARCRPAVQDGRETAKRRLQCTAKARSKRS